VLALARRVPSRGLTNSIFVEPSNGTENEANDCTRRPHALAASAAKQFAHRIQFLWSSDVGVQHAGWIGAHAETEIQDADVLADHLPQTRHYAIVVCLKEAHASSIHARRRDDCDAVVATVAEHIGPVHFRVEHVAGRQTNSDIATPGSRIARFEPCQHKRRVHLPSPLDVRVLRPLHSGRNLDRDAKFRAKMLRYGSRAIDREIFDWHEIDTTGRTAEWKKVREEMAKY
jgi:hypothetical protein